MIDITMANSPFGIGDHVTEPEPEPTLEEVGQAPTDNSQFSPEGTGESDSVEIKDDTTQELAEEGEIDE